MILNKILKIYNTQEKLIRLISILNLILKYYPSMFHTHIISYGLNWKQPNNKWIINE